MVSERSRLRAWRSVTARVTRSYAGAPELQLIRETETGSARHRPRVTDQCFRPAAGKRSHRKPPEADKGPRAKKCRKGSGGIGAADGAGLWSAAARLVYSEVRASSLASEKRRRAAALPRLTAPRDLVRRSVCKAQSLISSAGPSKLVRDDCVFVAREQCDEVKDYIHWGEHEPENIS